jgi:hypothetical protein
MLNAHLCHDTTEAKMLVSSDFICLTHDTRRMSAPHMSSNTHEKINVIAERLRYTLEHARREGKGVLT